MAQYFMRFGILYREHEKKALARIRGVLLGCEKKILCGGSQSVWRTCICCEKDEHDCARDHRYLMTDADGNEIICATPAYADGCDPDTEGWPVSRLPLVDHAQIRLSDGEYLLTMRDGDSFDLQKNEGCEPILILHRSCFLDSWEIDARRDFPAQFLCGMISFCKYIWQENELEVV